MTDNDGWTVATLKHHIDARLDAMEANFRIEIAARDKAVELQAKANDIHFDALNHENARIAAASATSVSRDTWDAFKTSDEVWKDTISAKVSS